MFLILDHIQTLLILCLEKELLWSGDIRGCGHLVVFEESNRDEDTTLSRCRVSSYKVLFVSHASEEWSDT